MNENQNTEFKQNWHDDYLQWVCGFANANGGTIYIGISDDGVVTGLDNYKRLMEDIPNKIRNSIGIVPDLKLNEAKGKKFIEVRVNSYSVPVSLRGRYYYRSGSTKMELTGVELNEFLLKKTGKTWDDVVEEGATIEDIDEVSLLKFIEANNENTRMPETKGLNSFQLLEKLQLTEGKKLRRAALCLFGRYPAKFYTNLEVRIGRFGIDATDLRFQEVVEGNLVWLLEEVLVQLNNKFLVRNVSFEGLQRIERNIYPIDALREMLLNALVHRTYMGAHVQLRVFDNKLSIWNEGGLPHGLTLDDLKREHNSRPRNPKIARTCFLAGYIDTWGRGTIKIIEACKAAGLPEPEILEKNGGIEVTLYASNQVGNQVGNQESNQVGTKTAKQGGAYLLTDENILNELNYKPSEQSLRKYTEAAMNLNANAVKVLAFCSSPKKRKEILEECLQISNQTKNFKTHIEPLIENGFIEPIIKDRPTSQYQKYVLSKKGRVVVFIRFQ
jgi:ATP-dependent DNA helicase RecG